MMKSFTFLTALAFAALAGPSAAMTQAALCGANKSQMVCACNGGRCVCELVGVGPDGTEYY